MRISRLKISNLFGITQLELDGKSIELSGKNGVGKSSVIDSIKYALLNSSDRKLIIKDGENEGEIFIEFDTGLNIDRKKRTAQADFKSVKQNGDNVGSPEAFLKSIFTSLQLDPIAFMEMTEREQNSILLNLIEYPWTLDTIKKWFGELPSGVSYDQPLLAILYDIQKKDGDYYLKRQDINRSIREKTAIVTEIGENLPTDYDGDKWEKVQLAPLYTEIEKIRKNNELIEKARTLKENRDNKIRKFEADKEIALSALKDEFLSRDNEIEKEILKLENKIKELRTEKGGLDEKKADKEKVILSQFEKSVASYDSEVKAYEEYLDMEIQPVDEKLEKARHAEEMKGYVSDYHRMLDMQDDIQALQEKSQSLTEKIEKARKLPGEIMETATIPVKGLTVKEGIPLINGLPISNLSSGEKLDLCIDISLQNESGLKLLLLDGTEKLSDEMRDHVYEKCKEKNVQIIATRTTNDDELIVTEL